MTAAFRNVTGAPGDDVRTWPHEALVATIERGLVSDWRPILAEIGRSPWGEVARRVERYSLWSEADGEDDRDGRDPAAARLFQLALERARARAEVEDRDEVAARVRAAVARSGLSHAEFARRVGTSASRLSTYVNGRVTPSAAMLVRIERTADA